MRLSRFRTGCIQTAIGGIVFLFWLSTARGQCGTERWDVKTGTDSDAGGVNLSTATPTTISALTDSAHFPHPTPFPPDHRVAPAETTVWVLDATLVRFKWENGAHGDNDYHLVLGDASGHTMVAEIPTPGCVGSGSPFASGIASSRSVFDSKFQATGQFQTVNTPVRVTGVGMFDFMHGQSGVAPNVMELHPVLAIVFDPPNFDPSVPPAGGLPPPSPVPQPPSPPSPANPSQVLLNPDFEDGPSGWTTTSGVISNKGRAHSGSWSAWLCGYGSTHTDTISQTVTLPGTATSATLTFWLHVETDETLPRTFDTLTVQVIESSGATRTLGTFSNQDAKDGFDEKQFDLSSLLGQTVQVKVTGIEDARKATSFFIDDVTLEVR